MLANSTGPDQHLHSGPIYNQWQSNACKTLYTQPLMSGVWNLQSILLALQAPVLLVINL